MILLPRVTENIAEYKKLNYHLYQALRKSLFRPEAFFRGILLPLCEVGARPRPSSPAPGGRCRGAR